MFVTFAMVRKMINGVDLLIIVLILAIGLSLFFIAWLVVELMYGESEEEE